MFFEATLGTDAGDRDYKIEIDEEPNFWRITIEEAGHPEICYSISKENYRMVENIINLIWKGSSYIMDCYGSGIDYQVYARSSYRNVRIYNDEALLHESLKKGSAMSGGDNLTAGMPGKIVKVMVEKGAQLKANQPVLIMEAMKMENEMRSTQEVIVKDILVQPGDSVESGQTLVLFEPVKKA